MTSENVIYDDFVLSLELRHKTRKEFRNIIVNTFLSENSGYWKDHFKHVTRYKYFVETLTDGSKIYIKRPAHLNKGMDFQVCAENFLKFKNGKDKAPSHNDILADLKGKKLESVKKFQQLMDLIKKVFNCEEPDDILTNISLTFKTGASVEFLLKVLKWLFIEQDMTYWNYDGREMFKRSIEKMALT